MTSLTCFKLRAAPEGPVSGFDAAVNEDKLDGLAKFGPIEIGEITAKLYLSPSAPHDPDWASFLRTGFGPIPVPPVGGASALLVVRVPTAGDTWYLAFTFGQGRFLLRADAFERGFGLRTCLNIIFEGDTGSDELDPSRLRSADAKRVGRHVLRTRHQVPDTASLEDLDINARREVLRGVAGVPMNTALWGSRVSGTDPLVFGWAGQVSELDQVCYQIVDAYGRTDYRSRFSFIDDLRSVTDPVLRTFLEEEVMGALLSGAPDRLDLGPPEILNWEKVSKFQYHSDSRKGLFRRELSLSEYLTTLSGPKLAALTPESLKRHDIIAVDDEPRAIHSWSVWRCLHGEVEYDNATYLLDDGEFWSVSDELLNDIDKDLATIPEFEGEMPEWIHGTREDDYNATAASGNPSYLLMDKLVVRVPRQTSDIEICDLLTDKGTFVHVKKRSEGSKGLSYLFWQGLVSATLLLGEVGFRKLAIGRICEAERIRADAEGDDSCLGKFQVLSEDSIVAADHEVVFAILGKWNDKGVLGLPFFSKMSLRETASELRGRGLRVSVKRVPRVVKPEL